MKLLRRPLLCIVILSTILTPVAGQQKRRNVEKTPAAKPVAAPAPATPTFETLLAADTYKVYGEVRNIGQLIKSSSVADVLEPVLKLGGPQKDFVDVFEWLKSHADDLTTSRVLVAAWPTAQDVPDFVAAIEFSSPEEAAKFEKPFNGVLPSLFPPVTPAQSTEPGDKTPLRPPAADQKPPAKVPGYNLQRAGSLLIVSREAVPLKKLRRPGSKPLSEDPNFRVAYNRFASEPAFVFIDLKALENERKEREKRWEEEQKKAAEAAAEAQANKPDDAVPPKPETPNELEVSTMEKPGVVGDVAIEAPTPGENESVDPRAMSAALTSIGYSLFGDTGEMPEALGIGFSPENDSFEWRLLMIDAAGKTSDPIPFLMALKFGAPIAPQSPTIMPSDSELVLTMSLDFPQIFDRMAAAPFLRGPQRAGVPAEGPFNTIEKTLKIKIKDDLLPLLGSEVSLSLPLADYNPFGPPGSGPVLIPSKEDASEDSSTNKTEFVAIAVRDKEGMRKLMPKLVEGFAGKAAVALAQTERREDTEIVSYANMFSYAFVGNFLVLSTNVETTRHVVDSYLKGATLSADVQFRNYTRWQPQTVQGAVYVSPSFMEGYKTWANSPNARITDEARAFFLHAASTPQPITYSVSNDGLGTLHELHVPKSVLLLAVAGSAAEQNPPPTVANERAMMNMLWRISYTETMYKQQNSTYGSLEELVSANLLGKEQLESANYKFEFTITADGFTISAVPTEYGKSGKFSFFLDQTGLLRGADHGGGPASSSDPPVRY